MRRLFLLILCALLMICGANRASALEGVYEDAGALYAAWVREEAVPDYITGVWSTDGTDNHLTFGLLLGEAGDYGCREILSLVSDDTTVAFVRQIYSRNDLYRIQEEVVDAYFEAGLGMVTAGVRERENRLCFEVHRDYAENADTQEMIQTVMAQYGNAVYFTYVDTDPELVTGTQPPAQPGPILGMASPRNLAIPYGLCGLCLAFLAFLQMRRHHLLAATAEGCAVMEGKKSLTKREVEAAIRNADCKPSDALDRRVMDAIGAEE